jgi:hypothetical protein
MLHALRQEGLSYSEIARRTGYERRSVAKWLKFKAPPDRRRAALNPTRETAAGGTCFMTSSSAVTPAASPIWSACWELGGGPKGSRPMMYRPRL